MTLGDNAVIIGCHGNISIFFFSLPESSEQKGNELAVLETAQVRTNTLHDKTLLISVGADFL